MNVDLILFATLVLLAAMGLAESIRRRRVGNELVDAMRAASLAEPAYFAPRRQDVRRAA